MREVMMCFSVEQNTLIQEFHEWDNPVISEEYILLWERRNGVKLKYLSTQQ